MLLRWIIDRSVAILGRLRTGQTVSVKSARSDGRICVNLGCGLAVAPGWINVDASLNAAFCGSPEWLLKLLYRASGANRYYSQDDYISLLRNNHFVFHDLSRSLPFASETVDVFYSSHFLEHIFHDDALRLLRNAHGALRRNGVIRLAIPDLAYAVRLYQQGRKREMLEDYFFVEDKSSFLARHKYMYDFDLLKEDLEHCGFTRVTQRVYRQGAVPDLEILDNRPEETLFVEAYK